MVKKDFLVPIIEWVLNLFLFPFDVYIITQKNFIGQRLFSCAIFQERGIKLTICGKCVKMKIKIENEKSFKMKMRGNFENENFYCSLRGLLKLKIKFENENYPQCVEKLWKTLWIKSGKLVENSK